VGGWAVSQLWLFWLAPIAGALAAGWLYRAFFEIGAEPDIAGR
jgi:aquaporin Z